MLNEYSIPTLLKRSLSQSTYTKERLIFYENENNSNVANFALSFHNGTLNRLEYVPSSQWCTVVKVAIPQTSGDYYIKLFSKRSFTDSLKQSLSGSRARKSARGSYILAKNGFFAPQAAVVIETQDKFLITSSILVTPGFLKADTLNNIIKKGSIRGSRRRKLFQQLGKQVALLHQAKIRHGELNPGNILVHENEENFEFVFIDNERTRKLYFFNKKHQIKNLQQLNKIKDGISLCDRLRLWKAYAAHFDFNRNTEKQIIAEIIELTRSEWDKGLAM